MKTKNPFAKQKVRKYKVLILTLFFFSFSVTCTQILAQDSLARYSLAELDTLYKHTKIPQDKLPYALAMLKTGEKQFNKQDTSYAKILFKVGNTYGRIRDFKNATIYLQKAIDIQKTKATNTSAYANSLNNLGMVYYYQFKLEKVENLWLEAMRIRKEILGKKHPDYATSLDLLGLLYKNLGDYEKAEIFIIQSFNIRKEILDKKHPDYANSLNNLGNLYAELGNYKKAELLYIEALNLKKEFLGKKDPKYASGLNNLGALYYNMGDLRKAESFVLQALNIRKETLGNKHPRYTSSLNNLGTIYKDMGDLKKAETIYLLTLKIEKEIIGENHPHYALTLNNLGIIYKNLGDYSKAQDYYLQALNIRKKVLGIRHNEYASSLYNLGTIYRIMEDYEKAEYYYLKSLNLIKEILGPTHPDYASSLLSLGNINYKKENYLKAERFYQKGLKIYKKTLGNKHTHYVMILNNFARLYESMNKIDKAWEYALFAIKCNTDINISTELAIKTIDSLVNGNYIAFESMSSSLHIVYDLLQKEMENCIDEPTVTGIRNKAQIKEKQSLICDLALKLLDRYKNELANENDKLRILSQNSEWVLRALQILDKDKEAKKALNFVEKNKSVLLLDAISNKQAYTSGLLPDSLILHEKNLQKKYANTHAALAEKKSEYQIDSIRAELTNIILKMDAFQEQLQKNYPKYANMRYQNTIIKANEIQASLDTKTALLEYLIGDSVVYIFYVDKYTTKMHEFLIDNAVLEGKIKSMHNTLSNYSLLTKNKSYINFTKSAYWFYENLLLKALQNTKDIESLIIITDGELGHLPFESFLTKQAPQTSTDYKELDYLINDYTISYNYSATLWKENNTSYSKRNNRQVLAMASNYDIQLDSNKRDYRLEADLRLRSRLKPLPAARKEVEALQENFNGFFAFDSLASEHMFKDKAADYGIIHLAMHGVLNKREQVLSSLAFTEIGDSAENNFLCAYEITKMDLNADLAILSACETGFGKFERGNGIASLARSFMYAGIPSMIVSLWQVNDHATSHVMQNLYNNIAEGMKKDEALRKAKLDYIKSAKDITAHPAFWSPFIMMGNTKAISISRKGEMLPWYIGGGIGLLFLGGFAMRRRKREAA